MRKLNTYTRILNRAAGLEAKLTHRHNSKGDWDVTKDSGAGSGWEPITRTGLVALVILLACAGCSTQPAVTWSQTDLALAYADRGLVLKSDGSVTLSQPGICTGPFKTPGGLDHCLEQHEAMILPALLVPGQLKPTVNSFQANLVRALPADADFTALARQQKLFASGEYLTWSGQVVHFPEAAQSGNLSHAVTTDYQPLAPPRKHQPLSINANKIILQ